MATRKPKPIALPETENAPRDYVAIAIEYAKAAIADRKGKRFGRWFRLAAKRFLADLKKAKRKNNSYIFDAWHANDACDFIEKLPHIEGTWETENIVMHASHVFFVVNLFGFRNRADGTRRFTTALFAIARKNAKSLLASGILLYCFCCEPENGPQVISAATTKAQAEVIFKAAKKMVEKTADLREAFTLQPFANAIARYEVGGTFRAISAKASTQDGLNPSHVSVDEIHAHKNHDLLNVLTSASGARRNPLFLYTTTEGYESPGPWPELRHFTKQILLEAVEADHFLTTYFAVDEEDKTIGMKADDDFDESKWVKANPLIEVNPLLLRDIRKLAIEAKAMPGKLAEFKIKRLNRPSAAAGAWVDLRAWNKCAGEVDLEWLKGKSCKMGMDLASTTDMASIRLVWRIDGEFYTYGKRYVPESGVVSRTERGSAPYAAWVETGLITRTPGNAIDYAIIEADIVDLYEKFKPSEIAYDPWNSSDIVGRLVDQELPMVEFIQGPKSYHPAMQALEVAYISGRLRHAGDKVLTWCASNLIARTDVNMNTAPDKKKSPDKIDDMCALLMAIGRLIAGEEVEESFWEKR